MGLADEIINGTYQYTSQKKKKKNVADEIINGNYQYKAEKTRQEQQEQEKQVVHQLLKGVGNNFNPIEKTGEVVSTVADKGNDLINYFASGKAQKDATQAAKNTGRFLTDMDYREKVGLDTLLSGANALNIAGKTVLSQVESGAKFLYNESTKATNWLNNQLGLMSDEQYQKAEEFRKNFMKENTTEKIWKNVFGWNDEVNDFVKKNSFITEDNFGGQTVQGLTQLMTTAAMGQTGFGWELPTFISSAGGAEQKAYQLGANDTQALAVGLFGGTLEVLTEKLGSGVIKVKGTGWKSFERLEDDLTNKISNNVIRYLAQTGVSAMNEGMEEVISGYGNAIAEKLTYMKDKDLKELYSSKDAFQDFMMATWTSLLAGGARAATPSGGQQLREDIRSGRSQITGFTQNEQNIIDSEVAQRIQEAKEKGQKVKTGEIVEQVQEDLRNGDLSAESIQRGINGEKYQTFAENETKLKETQSQLEEVEKNLKDNYSSKVSKLNPEYEQLLQQQKDLSEQINVLKNNQQALGRESYLEARELSQNDALAQRSLYEYEQGGRHFEYKLDDNASERTKGLYESASQNGNNTTKFRNFVKGLDTLQNSTDKSYQYRFTNTEELREKGLLGKTNYDVQEGDTLESIAKKHNMSVDELKSMNKNLDLTPGNKIKVYAMSNGLKAGNTIYLNIDTNDSLETVLGHEVTHLLEGTDDYDTLQKLLYKQAKKNGIYDSKRAEVEELYAAENADIDSELTAELAKELFTDENFINELTTKPTTFKKVLNFIDDLITKFTGSSEEVELRKIKKQFQEAFNNMKSYDESNKVQHSLTNNIDTNTSENKINTSMTMDQAKDLVQRTFILNDIKNWYDGKYQNGDEWLKGEGIDEVEMYAENTELIQSKFLNQLYDKDNGFQDDYYISDILQAYQDGTLTGEVREDVGRVDTTQDTGFQDSRFYAPRDIELTRELYDKANQRVTNKNREEIYKARADFIIAAHQRGMAQQIGLTQQEVNAKLKSWANYPQKAMELSNQMNENVARQNQWTGLENSSIVNTISISNEDMGKLVKEIKGDSNGWQRQYITGTMLALDTHIDYSNLTFDFEQGAALREKHAAGDYDHNTDIIRIGEGYQNTVAHEMGHYVDYLWGKQFFNKGMPLSDLVKSYDRTNLSQEQIQFLEHFNQFQESIEASGEKGDTLKYGSSRNAGYWQKPTEAFARFVGKFTEWTRNQATNNRYGYDEKFYKDNFTESQYRDFIKLLQEKAAIDTSSNLKYNSLNQELIDAIDSLTDEQKVDIKNIIDNEGNIPSYQVTDDLINILGKDNYYLIGKNKLDELVNRNFYQQTEEPTNVQYSISKQDSQGRELSEKQQDYYKDSKVRDQDGNLLVMYNGRYSDDTVFKPSSWTNEKNGPTQIKGYFATDSSYSEIYGDVSEYYLNIKNPLYMGLEDGNEALTLNEWQQFFKEHGITGVEFDSSLYGVNTKGNIAPEIDGQKRYLPFEIVDSDEYWNNNGNVTERIKAAGYDGLTWTEGGQAYMPFESNQIKRIDNVDPTTSDDIRYSISKDNQGRNLTKEQQEYFRDSKVVDDNNNLKEVYHRTYTGGFTVFQNRKGVHWFTDTSDATYYGDNKYSVYLNIKNPLIIDAQGKNYNQIEFSQEGLTQYNSTTIKDVIDNIDKATKEDIVNLAKAIDKNNSLGDYIDEFDTPMQMLESVIEAYDEGSTIEEFKNNYGRLSMFVENDSIPSRKTTTTQDITDYAKLNGYDGVIFNNIEDMTNGVANVYAAFNSNQIKNVDNLNPTTNEDIRYSMSNDIAPIRQRGLTYDVGVRQEQSPELIDIAPINERIDEARKLRLDYDSEVKALEELDNTIGLDKADSDRLEYLKSLTQTTNESTGQEYTNEYSPFEKAKKNLAENKVKRFIEKETYKAIDKAAKVAAQYGEFNRKEKTNLRNEFKRFSNLTSEQLTNPNTYNEFKDIIRQYADREMNFTDYHLKEVRDDIRKRKINVSDIRNQITDFNDYRRQYFGRLNLTNEGMTIDQHYQELSELYPEYFSKDITTEADMLNQLMDFMDLDTTITEKYRLSDDEIDRITSKAFSTLVTESPTEQQIQEYEEEINRSVERKRSEVRRQQLLDEMGLTIDDIAVGKDINALGYQRTDPIRLNEKVFGYEVGKKINDATIRQTIHNTAEKMRWQNQERSEIEDLGIKARSKESAAVQKYGEGEYVNDLGELVKYGDKELASEFPNIETQDKIKRAAEVLRGKYDTYIDQINDVLTDLGYDAIPKRKNYFRHFIELNDKFSQWGTPFNRQTMQEQDLPTDINGLTDQFKPGKQYFASALERKGIKTTYDAITGIDGYIETAGNLIFHTEDIQRYRALSKLIRETYGQQHGLDNIDIMTEDEKNQRVEDVYGNKLTKYAAWLDEQANALAGKKAGIDRAVERMLGRKVYTAASTLKSQVGSNMTGFNVRSAMTNFASVVQGASKTSKIALLKGTVSTIQNMIHDDGMTQKSDFLTGRYGTNQLSQKAWQKIANAGQIFMEASDHFTSNQIWRSKYYELLDRGMSETEAIREADDFAARVMGNRVQGATAEIFNSKTLGFLTQFQLEVNNQWSNMIHDNKMDIQSGKKGAASVVFQLGQLYGLSYMFNTIMKGLTGSDVMFDPIDLLMKLFNPDDDDKTTEERARDVLGDIVNQLPMASIFTGGRIPIQEAFSGVSTGFKYLTGQENEYGQKYTAGDVFDDSLESLAYLLLPTGYGQLRKTYKGTIDTDYDVNLNPFKGEIGITERPIRGSYTDSGNLRFTADNDIPGRIRSALFGQYANSEAQDYINSGYQTINAKKIPELQEFEMTSSEYKKWQKEYSKATATTEEIDGVKYTKYKDSDGNIYLYDKNTRTLLDSNGNKSNKNVTTMTKVDKKELVYDYIKNSDFTPEQKEYLFDENFDNTTTDKYGYEKYTERTTDKKGKPVTKTYWYDSDTNTLYDSKYKVSNKDINSLTKVSSDKSVEGYNSFDTYEEFDYSYKNPEKYKLIQDTGSYKKYKTNETYQKAVDWAYNTPSNYSMSKALDGIENTYTYLDKLNDIKGDKNKYGKTISGSRKTKVFNYINSLNLTPVQKAMLVRTQYSSYDDYNNEIVNYLNNQTSITLDEEYEILKKLGYKVKGDRVSW